MYFLGVMARVKCLASAEVCTLWVLSCYTLGVFRQNQQSAKQSKKVIDRLCDNENNRRVAVSVFVSYKMIKLVRLEYYCDSWLNLLMLTFVKIP